MFSRGRQLYGRHVQGPALQGMEVHLLFEFRHLALNAPFGQLFFEHLPDHGILVLILDWRNGQLECEVEDEDEDEDEIIRALVSQPKTVPGKIFAEQN